MNIGKYDAEKLETATLRRSSATTGATVVADKIMVKITQMQLQTLADNGTGRFRAFSTNWVRPAKQRTKHEDERGESLSWQSRDNQKHHPATPRPPCIVAEFPARPDRLPVPKQFLETHP